MAEFFTINANTCNEYIVEKSKFLGFAYHVQAIDEIDAILAHLKQKYFDATHVCYAFDLINSAMKCFDDGEPSGTAGKPILDCIQKQKLKNVLVVVVRYFGGIKLGAGGLSRAYSKSASLVLTSAQKRVIQLVQNLNFSLDLKQYNIIKNFIDNFDVLHKEISFKEHINIDIVIDTKYQQSFLNSIVNILKQEIIFHISDAFYY